MSASLSIVLALDRRCPLVVVAALQETDTPQRKLALPLARSTAVEGKERAAAGAWGELALPPAVPAGG